MRPSRTSSPFAATRSRGGTPTPTETRPSKPWGCGSRRPFLGPFGIARPRTAPRKSACEAIYPLAMLQLGVLWLQRFFDWPVLDLSNDDWVTGSQIAVALTWL